MAGDARVTISPIHTSGLPLNWVYSNGGTQAELVGRSWRQLWAFQDSKAMAEKTGGVGSFYQEAAKGFDEIERRTRFQYVLGYYPSAKDLDGAWRRIRVVVDRPDVAVRHRQGYFAQAATIPTDPTLFLPYVRITAAGMQRESIADIPVGLTLPQIRRNGGETRLTIDVLVSATNLALAQTGDGQVAKLELAVFVGDSQEGVVGETWDRVEQALDERTLARVRREGISRTVTVNVRGEPAYVKAVVYNPVSDRLGSISKSLRRGRR
jgi:hypothetical protein